LRIAENDLLDIFYNGLTESSKYYLDSCSCNIFRNEIVKEAKELLNTIAQNYQDWNVEPKEKENLAVKKRGIVHFPKKKGDERSYKVNRRGRNQVC
jgi:phage pi2 protein 07